MPDNLRPPRSDVLSRVESCGLQQLTLLESTIHELRTRMNDVELDVDDVGALAHQIMLLSQTMLSWVYVLTGPPTGPVVGAPGPEYEEEEE